MKRWVLLVLAVFLLMGVAALLLTTRQAPMVFNESEPEEAEIASPLIADEELAPVPASDIASVKHLSTEEFRKLGAEVMRALPTKKDLQKLKEEEAGGAPPALISAGVELGKIAKAVANEPALEGEALILYRECAASPQHPDSVRALCFSNYKSLATRTGAPFNEGIVKKSLRQLSEKLDF